MSNRLKSIIAALMITITSVFGVLLSSTDIHATTTSDLLDKFYARGLAKCYESGAMVKSINAKMAYATSKVVVKSDKMVGLPPEGDSSVDVSCEELLEKIGFSGISSSNSAEKLTELGYVKDSASDYSCMKFNFETDTQNSKTAIVSPVLCAKTKNGGVIDGDIIGQNAVPPVKDSGEPDGSELYFEEDPYSDTVYFHIGTDDAISQSMNCPVDASTTWAALTNCFKNLFNDKGTFYPASMRQYRYKGNDGNVSLPDSLASYSLTNDSSHKAWENIKKSKFPNLAFNNQEKTVLYQNYLVSFYNVEKENCVSKKSDLKATNLRSDIVDKGLTDGWNQARLFTSDGKPEYCYVKGSDDRIGKGVYGVQAHGGTEASMVNDPGTMNILDILDWLNKSNLKEITDKELLAGLNQAIVGDDTEGSKEDSDDDTSGKSCFDGAGALGWVLCSVLEGTSWAVNQIYGGFIEPALTINADLLTDESAYSTWQIFQTFANIAFAIMILVVIISQLTGVGIDNYGIKRILPRLIIAALLINLSFIICQLAVDLSNILGVSLKNLFDGLGPNVSVADIDGTGTGTAATFVTIIVSVVAVGGAFLALGLGVIIPILIAALSALIAIFFLFLILSARQAAVLILVVISPLALVMYMLPNTKKYFDKFVKIFITLLVVFPICGLVMGGGDFASRVLLSAGGASANSFSEDGSGFFYQISAVLISIVPFFFIPTLVKSSLAGLGNIGTKISSIGNRASSGASGRIKNSQAYKDQMDRAKSGTYRSGNVSALGRIRRKAAEGKGVARFIPKGARRSALKSIAASQAMLDKRAGEESAARASLAMQDYGNKSENEVFEAWNKAFDKGNTDDLLALTSVAQSRFGPTAAKRIGSELANKTGVSNNENYQKSLAALQGLTNRDGKFAGDLKAKAYDAHAMITGGGKDGNGNYQDLAHFTGDSKQDLITKTSEWATQGSSTLSRAAASGALTPAMAQQIRDSDDPAIKSGIMSDAKSRRIIEEVAGGPRQSTDGSTTPPPAPGPTGATPTGRPGGSGSNPEGSEFKIDHNNQNSPDRGSYDELTNDFQNQLDEGGYNQNGGDV